MDESHIGIPQIRGMIKGDQARKRNLVDYGFRLPSALDNRPLKFEEWEKKVSHAVCTSATPGPYELKESGDVWVDQVIRPTGLVDPDVEIRPVVHQIDDLLGEIRKEVAKGHRVLVTTLTKKMAENISEYYADLGIAIEYLHSDIGTVERMEIIRGLRQGKFDVLIGINLLREGLDLPEVGLVAILDGDKAGFLRDTRSLIQTIGRASRNVDGRAVIYADKETNAIREAIKETNRRRDKQLAYNKLHNIIPQTIKKRLQESLAEIAEEEPTVSFTSILQSSIEKNVNEEELLLSLEDAMYQAAKNLEFENAAQLRDLIKDVKTGKQSIEDLTKTYQPDASPSQKTSTGRHETEDGDAEKLAGFQLMGTLEHFSEQDRRRLGTQKKKSKKSSRKKRYYKSK